jgi:hypothetical protein
MTTPEGAALPAPDETPGVIDEFTVGEFELIEATTGKPLGLIVAEFQADSWSISVLTAMLWVLRLREDPGSKLADLSQLGLNALQEELDERTEGSIAPPPDASLDES